MVWSIIVWIVLGGLIGWIASIIMRTDAQQGILLNIVVGVGGAMIGAVIFFRGDFARPINLSSFVVALLGAILLLAIVNLFTRRRIR